MREFWNKIRSSWINSLLFSCFLLAIFLLLFYLSNLEIKKAPATVPVQEVSLGLDSNAELKKRLGSSDFSFSGYDFWASQNNLGENVQKYDGDPDKDSLPNYWEYVYGTDPNNPDTDGDKYGDKQEIINGYDPDAPGDAKPMVEIAINKINIRVPMIWSLSEDETLVNKDLENGVSHFYKTASPGQSGNMIISGHSSNYIWAAGNYNHIFKDLNNLEAGDKIDVKTIQQNGRVITYHYKISNKFIAAPDDARIFENTSAPTITLSTCWPLGTTFRRLIVKGELTK